MRPGSPDRHSPELSQKLMDGSWPRGMDFLSASNPHVLLRE
ncbi:hypothetical protein [Streptomyces pratensis]